jgi:hypothetical protein
MFTSSTFAPPRTCSSATSSAPCQSSASTMRRKRAEPVTFVRSPTTTKPVSGLIVNGSIPLNRGRRSRGGMRRGACPRTASTIDVTCSGVVPQQPPTTLTSPSCANSPRNVAVSCGCSSCSPISFGSPAFGWQLTYVSAWRERLSTNGRISVAPSEQLTPTTSGAACSIEYQKASTVWPERFRPLRSIAVNEIQRGTSGATSSAAAIAAFALSVSKIVSIKSRSTPPSTSARICSAYAVATSSNVDARNVASSTRGETDSETLSGPIDPATHAGRSSSSAARRASRAPSRLISAA